jgi:UDP-N-acetyl-D-mannosaminuronic acid dehydrogenase
MSDATRDVGIIGGGGHVGLPLGLTFADSGLRTVIYDIDRTKVQAIRQGIMPFVEQGAAEILRRVLAAGTLEVHDTPELLGQCRVLVLIIGTPIDEHLNPSFTGIQRAVEEVLDYLHDGQILILRSTVFPGITSHVKEQLHRKGLNIAVAFCPERVAEGSSLREFRELPQIIGAAEPSTARAIRRLFSRFTDEFIEMEPMEAELCKLMTNAWRYIQFAAVNQFYMIASEHGLDFSRILHGCRHKYPRTSGMPGPGLAAGPCLMKDTMQLAAFSHNSFPLGHAAVLINEGLPAHLVEQAKRQVRLAEKTAGILGMAFKAESDDPRDSLSYKLRKLLLLESSRVLCTDPYVSDPTLDLLDRVLEESDVLFLAVPHKAYLNLRFRPDQLVIDVWNCVSVTR